ncbi:MAG: lamin tail domain-containing protein, partial [Planctomycetes bacterium]|nr:lamin tail domain-containing protein [Planctomycetota bacterium]
MTRESSFSRVGAQRRRVPRERHVPRVAALALVLGAFACPGRLGALIVTEIMYHSEEPDDRPFEWIELYNENADALDLSGFTICGGIRFELPLGTWLDGKSFLVVCADASNVQAKHGIANVLGDWFTDPSASPSLSNGGERIEVCNPGGRTVAEVRYNDRGKWPAGADGTGHSLALRSYWSDIDDPDGWAVSLELGGTPGAPNGFSADEGGGTPPPSGLDGAGFVVKWLVLGPYTGSSCSLGARLTRDWLRESAGGALETHLFWSKGQVVNTNYSLAESDGLHANAGTALPTVKEIANVADTVDFNEVVWPPDPNQVMAHAFVYVDNVTAAPLAVDIACASDDAIAVLLNGAYVHANDACRGGGGPGEIQDRAPATLAVGKNLVAVKVFENGGGWNFRLRFEERGTGAPIASRSKIQVTTDYTKGLDFGGGGTPIEPPTDPPPPPPGTEPGEAPVILSEGFFRTAGERWVELHNRSAAAIDVAGHYLTDDPSVLAKAPIAAPASIPAGGYRAFTDAELGLDFSVSAARDRVFVALVAPSGDQVLDAYNFEPRFDGYSEARVTGDDRRFTDAADPTRGAPNAISTNGDVVINEIMYHPIDGDNRKEYLELYNKGPVAYDLTGWRMSDGVQFDIPPGTVISAGGYLVIARDPTLFTGTSSIYGLPAAAVLGPASPEALAAFGVLRDRGERVTLTDQLDRVVDTVRFHDGGEWPRWADGLGSALELIDATQDNRFGQAWDASDDSAKAPARTYSYIARHGNRDSELAIALLSAGIAVVDDVSIIGGGVSTTDRPFIEAGEEWRYSKGTAAPPAGWTAVGFADGSWLSGPTGIGYGDNDDATVLSDMRGSYVTVFCRKAFTVADRGSIDELV